MFEFGSMQTTLDSVNAAELVDIRDIAVDKSLPKEQRIAEYIKQIKNPYFYRCGKFVVQARFADTGASLEDCLKSILL